MGLNCSQGTYPGCYSGGAKSCLALHAHRGGAAEAQQTAKAKYVLQQRPSLNPSTNRTDAQVRSSTCILATIEKVQTACSDGARKTEDTHTPAETSKPTETIPNPTRAVFAPTTTVDGPAKSVWTACCPKILILGEHRGPWTKIKPVTDFYAGFRSSWSRDISLRHISLRHMMQLLGLARASGFGCPRVTLSAAPPPAAVPAPLLLNWIGLDVPFAVSAHTLSASRSSHPRGKVGFWSRRILHSLFALHAANVSRQLLVY
jgi:hypothetical protein